jgi:small-conductance mechanosensitive channel
VRAVSKSNALAGNKVSDINESSPADATDQLRRKAIVRWKLTQLVGASLVLVSFVGYLYAMSEQKLQLIVTCAVATAIGFTMYAVGRWRVGRLR